MRWVDEMTLAIGKADHIRVLSDLSGDVVGAMLDEDDRRPSDADPFAAALKRYQEEGHPLELAGGWRNAIAAKPVVASEGAARVLRLLARDLLACVATRTGATPAAAEPEREAPPANVRPIDRPAAPVPALELARDGTWKPSSTAARAEELESGRRPAYVPTLTSRYPDTSGGQGTHTMLPPAPPSTGFTLPAPRKPAPAVTPPPAPAAPAPTAPVATSAQSVIQAVSGGTELIAGPFDRFQQLAAFVRALRALSGVQDVTTRQFVRGMVHLRVRYADAIALTTRLEGMAEFQPEIVSSTPTRIEIRVSPPDDAPPARG